MKELTNQDLESVFGGQCTGGGNAGYAGASCTVTVYENKNLSLQASLSANTRTGITGGGVGFKIGF
ncbi:hypothetical protein [Paludibacterium sp. B53371]|uniref:hypothetical protein n=1 Tax=Paludibacterium sp. B53371 TaxID=2806263 RepID=UPI001C053F64|nr:hypothetical protein [Paludibacterium sp. B53371]